MNELENPQRKEIERRARWGAIALTLRTALAQVIILGGTVVMARHLRPAEFGAFAIIQFVLAFISAFGDAGLGSVDGRRRSGGVRGGGSRLIFHEETKGQGKTIKSRA